MQAQYGEQGAGGWVPGVRAGGPAGGPAVPPRQIPRQEGRNARNEGDNSTSLLAARTFSGRTVPVSLNLYLFIEMIRLIFWGFDKLSDWGQ